MRTHSSAVRVFSRLLLVTALDQCSQFAVGADVALVEGTAGDGG